MYQDIQNEDGTVVRWQDGITTTYANEQEARMATQPTALDTFAVLNGMTQTTAKQLLRQLDELNDILLANPQIEADARAAVAGALVGTSSYTKEQVLTAVALVASIRAYVDTDLFPGLKVRHAVYKGL